MSKVQQGSALGSLLCFVYIGDVNTALQYSEATSYADDTRIKKQIVNMEYVNWLLKDLNQIFIQALTNNMVLRGTFELLRYGT